MAGTAVYQVGRNSASQPKNCVTSKPDVQTTLDPAASPASRPEIKPCPWKIGSTFSNRSRGPSDKWEPTLPADRQTLACVSGTVLGRDVVPDVRRMNASSVVEENSSCPDRGSLRPEIRNEPAARVVRGKTSITGMPAACATRRLAEFASEDVNSAA